MAQSSSIARRLAAQMWGTPDRQRKLADGIWDFSTPSHGGIVVDTDVRTELKSYNQQVCKGRYVYYSEQHFAAFEEDCMAPIVEWVYAADIHTKKFRSYFVGDEELTDEEYFAKRLDLIRRSLEQWNPEVLKKYPEPSMGCHASKIPLKKESNYVYRCSQKVFHFRLGFVGCVGLDHNPCQRD